VRSAGFGEAARRAPYPAWAGPAERLRYLLEYAVEAHSRYDSQPWLFEIEGAELRLFVDRRRALKAADPRGRHLFMACGAALESLTIAAAHFGHRLEALPPGEARDLVARVRLAERHHPTPEDDGLFEALSPGSRRHSSAPDQVPQPLLAELARGAEPCAIRALPDWAAAGVAELVAEAEAVQWASPRFRVERAAWTTRRGRAPASVPRERVGLLRRLFTRGTRARAEVARRGAERTRTLILLHTAGDAQGDWIAAGAATQRLRLRAAARGYASETFDAAVEVADVRRRLRAAAGVAGSPQALVRLARGTAPERAPRRPLGLVLRSFATEVAVELQVDEAARAG